MALRIAHFVQRYPPALGGSEAYFQRLSRHLVSAGHSVDTRTTTAIDLESLWSRRGRSLPPGESDDGGVRVRRYACERWPLRRYILKGLSLLPLGPTWKCLTMPCNPVSTRMWRDAGKADERYDVVHATAFPYAWPIVCARRLARRCGAPFFITPFLHLGSPDASNDPTRRQYLAPQLRSLLRSADGVFVQTPSECAAVLGLGIDKRTVILQGMGVDPSECTGGEREAARRAWGVRPGQVVVGHLANLSYEKGTIDLLLAAEMAWQDGAAFGLVLAGADMPNFQSFWQNWRLRERVTLLGVLDDNQKRDFFAGIDIFALPSRSDSFGLVLLEAWANGLPNIAYRAGGVADVIRDEQDGILVPIRPDHREWRATVSDLAAALTRLSADPELRRRLGRAGHGRIGTDFRWADKLRIVEEIYLKMTVPE